ncbi:MAG TPA: universal stress protein [Terriglobales bacterium]|jgi:nucleotide-binding universal stress UspA family protein|nr:universal stress protein [Terriglobales bacterium]
MNITEVGTRITVKNILYLTDFSEPSAAALPFTGAIARGYGATVHVLHVLIPPAYVYTTPELAATAISAEEEDALAEMQRLESQLAGLAHETNIERGTEVWPAVESAIKDNRIDLIVVGTHGRTGAQKLLLGSIAEEIFRRSPVPVLTIGPDVRGGAHNAGRFHRILLATDFSPESLKAAAYAVSLAHENESRLILLRVMRKPSPRNDSDQNAFEVSVAEALHQLYEIVPPDVTLNFPAEAVIEYGDPAERIVEAAKRRGADMVVMGVRAATGRIGAATHLERAVAHKVVTRAPCPVLTVRG